MLAVKFKKGMDEVTESTTIKAMAGGKSAIQNEVVGELQTEFGSGPEGGAEMPLTELASKFPGYNALGKVCGGHVNKMLQGKMPGGFSASQAKSYLADDYKLGPGRTDSVLLHGVTMQPPSRLGSVAEAKTFLDSCCTAYGSAVGVSISKGGGGGGGGGGGMMMPQMMMMGGGGGGAPADPVPDVPVEAVVSLRVMLAVKFKKTLAEVPATATIKGLAGGKSAIQNEVVGELQAEFGSGPEGGAEMPLSELAGKFPGYTALGKVLNGHVNKMLQGKMPGGFSASQAKAYLGEERLVGPVRENASFCASLDFQ
jgi:3-oxoacyl-ACP reductase-like protein